MPRTMSRNRPSPVLFTILLPIKPAKRPRTIHARIDIKILLMRMRRPTFESDPTGSWAGTMAEALGFAYTLMPVFLGGGPIRNVSIRADHRDDLWGMNDRGRTMAVNWCICPSARTLAIAYKTWTRQLRLWPAW